MPALLWPRSEVLQLVTPQLATAGRTLTNKLVLSVLCELRRAVALDGKLSFARWLVGAKTYLKWNDHCIQLFWDMLQLAVSYLSPEESAAVGGGSGGDADISDSNISSSGTSRGAVCLEHVALFLLLHVGDGMGPQLEVRVCARVHVGAGLTVHMHGIKRPLHTPEG